MLTYAHCFNQNKQKKFTFPWCEGVVLWAMFCGRVESCPSCKCYFDTVPVLYQNIVADHVHTSIETIIHDGCGLFQQDNAHCHNAKMVLEWLRSTKMSLRCWFGLHNPQISIQLSIGGMCWTSKSDPWRFHPATCSTAANILVLSWPQTFLLLQYLMPPSQTPLPSIPLHHFLGQGHRTTDWVQLN